MVSAIPSATRDSGPVVVCVDDDPQVLNAVKRLLRREPYDLLTTDRPSTALRWIGKRKVDLLITDLKMPEMSGTDLIKVVEERSPDTQSLILTGFPEKASADPEAHPRLITKPWNDSEFKETIRSLVVSKESPQGPPRLEATTPSPKARVLVVDAHPQFRLLASGALASQGFDLQFAGSGGEALGILRARETPVEMVLLSPETVPGGDVDFIRLIRRLVPGLHVQVVADAPERAKIGAWYQAGAVNTFQRSISEERLIDLMKRSVVPARRSRIEAWERTMQAERRSADSWYLRLLRRMKSILHAPSGTRSGELRTLAAMAVMGTAVGAVFAVGYQSTSDLLSPEAQLREILAERRRPQTPQEDLLRRWYMSQQLDLTRQMNEETKRYYDAQLFERRWESSGRVRDGGPMNRESSGQERNPWMQATPTSAPERSWSPTMTPSLDPSSLRR